MDESGTDGNATRSVNDRVNVVANPWAELRRFTAARIALGRAGISLPTDAQLEFQLAHAQARDAVHTALDVQALSTELQEDGVDVLQLRSAAADRVTYLQRPDLGRRLSAEAREILLKWGFAPYGAESAQLGAGAPGLEVARYDVAFAIVDGLSALAIQQHAVQMFRETKRLLDAESWHVGPVALVQQGRVAVGDEIGELLHAQIIVVLIGERPGLSSPDSLGVYLTYHPRVGRVDSERNCISNIRPAGLPIPVAAHRLHYLLSESCRKQLSGVGLKDESDSPAITSGTTRSFLTEG